MIPVIESYSLTTSKTEPIEYIKIQLQNMCLSIENPLTILNNGGLQNMVMCTDSSGKVQHQTLRILHLLKVCTCTINSQTEHD